MASPTTLHIGRQRHMMHSQGPSRAGKWVEGEEGGAGRTWGGGR